MKKNRFVPEEIPNWIRESPKKRAEVLCYDTLRQQINLMHRDWVVIYSARWLSKPNPYQQPRTGEADFLLAHPQHGLVVAEVKGGLITFENGQWCSTDRHGNRHAIDPFNQVERNAYELAGKFEQMGRWAGGSKNDKYARWVIFPDSAAPRNAVYPPDYEAEMVTDLQGMTTIVDGLLRTLRYWYGDQWHHPAAPHACDLLLDLFDRPITFTMPLGARLTGEAETLERLTDSQFKVISAVAGCPRVAVAGGAGSGKTWLARKRAVQLADEGFRVLLTCKSRPLAGHLDETTPKNDNLVISAYEDLLAFLGGQPDTGSETEYGWQLAMFVEREPSLTFDALFVDEGQDFTEDEWLFVEGLLGPEKKGVFYVFYDDNQHLAKAPTALPSGMVPLQLDDNVRTTRSIHKVMARYYHGSCPQRPQGPTGRSAERISSNGNLPKCIRQKISDLLKSERISAGDIVVLTPAKLSESQLNELSLANGLRLSAGPRPGQDVLLSSIKDFKGLERPVVIVTEFDRLPFDDAERRRLLYTALSRPKSYLILIDEPGEVSE